MAEQPRRQLGALLCKTHRSATDILDRRGKAFLLHRKAHFMEILVTTSEDHDAWVGLAVVFVSEEDGDGDRSLTRIP